MPEVATPEKLGEVNRMLILNHLRQHGPKSRADLSRELSISFPTVSTNVRALIAFDYIKEVGVGDNSLGRKSILLAFNEERGYVIGVDLGRFKTRIMMADLLGNVVVSYCEPTNVEDGSDVMLQNLLSMLLKVVEKSKRSKEKVQCICIGTPGVIQKNNIILAPFLPDISPVSIKNIICSEFQGADIMIENSVNLGAIGEKWLGSGKKFNNFGFINYGVGVGAALIINGEIYTGANGAAGEVGFMVSDPSKLRDEFDEVGVMENIISRDKMQRFISHDNFQEAVAQLIQKYKDNDTYSKMILDEIYLTIGMAMINISAVLNLEAIIISGGLGTSIGRLFENKWNILLKKHVPFPPQIMFSEMNNLEGVFGGIYAGIKKIHTPVVI